MINIQPIVVNPFQVNMVLIWNDETKEAVVIDCACGGSVDRDKLTHTLEQSDLKLVGLYFTHLHVDHVLGTGFFAKKYNLNPKGHKADEFLYQNAKEHAQLFGLKMEDDLPTMTEFVSESDVLTLCGAKYKVIHIPGHSPGSVCYYNETDKHVIVGDVLFMGSIGRTDLWGGNHELLISGIKEKLMTMPDDVIVYPGHGPATTIGQERQSNPFIK